MTTFSFYFHERTSPSPAHPVPAECQIELWRPSLTNWRPEGMPGARNALIWALFHHARIFANRDYSILLIRRGRHVIHRSFVFPGWFRFPFMEREDLQVGDTWTEPTERGRGLATCGLTAVVQSPALARRIWYIVDESHGSSVRVAKKCGFVLYGAGRRQSRWGLRGLGSFVLEEPSSSDAV